MMEQKHLTEKEIKQIVKKLKLVWSDISYIVSNSDMRNHAEDLFKQVKTEAKQHDFFRSDGIKRGISINEESLLFSCKTICDHLYDFENYKPIAEDYLSVKISLFIGYAIAFKMGNRLRAKINKDLAEWVFKLDYCELI